jgi:predicted patatin/cPLA2 family phospholipase
LAFLYERGERQYDLVYAASSGACSAAYFVAGMWETGLTIWREFAGKAVRKTNFLRRKPIIDLAYLVDHIFKQRVPLSIESVQKSLSQFYIVLTDCHTGDPVYFHARDERLFEALRATASMPFATHGYHFVDGHPFADGGVSDPVPIHRALQDGATDITVVLTHNPSFRLKPVPRFLGRLAFPKFPAVARAWTDQQHLNYNAATDLMSRPPAGIRLRVFHPIRPMKVGAFTIEREKIHAAVSSGHDEALQQIAPTWTGVTSQLTGISVPK